MDIQKPDPDRLIKAKQEDGAEKVQGKLKIFFGYSAGVGKTYAMLEAAHQARTKGEDVVTDRRHQLFSAAWNSCRSGRYDMDRWFCGNLILTQH